MMMVLSKLILALEVLCLCCCVNSQETFPQCVDDSVLRQMMLPLLTLQEEWSERPAYIYNFATNLTTKTHSELHRDADLAAAVLRRFMSESNKANDNERVVLAMSLHAAYEAQVALLACFKNAYAHMPVTNIMGHPRFYPDSLDILDPALIIVDFDTYKTFPFFRHWSKVKGRPMLLLDSDQIRGVHYLMDPPPPTDMNREMEMPRFTADSFPLDHLAAITFSSGSTGMPKMVAHTFRSHLLTIRKSSNATPFGIDAVVHAPSGTEDQTVNTKLFLPSILHGACTLGASRGMDAEHADLRALYMNEKMMRRLTYFLSCPEGVSFWVDVLEETHGTNVVTNLSMIETSGAKLFDAVRDKVAHFFRISDITQDGPRFMERMGTSEGMRIGTRNAMGPPGFDLWEGVEIHVKPINASVRKTLNIMDCDDCLLVGELFIRTDNMMKGYLQANQTFVAPFDDEGWWGSGDIAYIDADGKYYLVGRSRKTINIDGDEYDPAVIHDAWVEILTFAEEMLLVRDDNHLGTSQAPVLFCKAGSNSGVTTMEEAIDWIDDGLKEVDWESDTYKAVGLYSTFAVLFVDEFPRSGGRRKIDGPKVQRLFTSSVKPALMATGDIQDNVYDRAVAFLKWNHLLDEYELLEWRSTEK